MESQKTSRCAPDSIELDNAFIMDGNNNIAQQYFALYKHRLQTLRPSLLDTIRQKWGDVKICKHIQDCQYGKHDEMVIVGTLFKDMKNKQDPLHEIENDTKSTAIVTTATDDNDDCKNERNKVSQLIGLNINSSDFLMLEDELSSIKLAGACLRKHKLMTGLITGVKGHIHAQNGYFIATDYTVCGLPPINARSNSIATTSNNSNDDDDDDDCDKYVALVSGLEISNMQSTHSANLQLLFDFLSGFVGDAAQRTHKTRRICRVLFVGNVICEELPDEDENIFYDTAFKKNEQVKIRAVDSRLKELDVWLSQLCASVPVDVMPGFNDPSDDLLPQQPFHRSLFPTANSLSSFRCVSNPYSLTVDGCSFLGSSGQNFRDMMKHSQLNMMECMELSLRARLLAPTAPDTLSCFPFKNNDPFVIHQCPYVYFCGNNDGFRVKTLLHPQDEKTPVCLLQIPSFVTTQQIVLFNVKTLTPELMQICCV
eukprot:CAMPEP_0202691468 /NCGR_PEP_ID=MMETSP1385-20130828/6171_1 /ASSEMBLY_ACC=CAM_ASM_000861 /TAXON_ID=933848 /ORGANISM="Elphidium margaritaceum" /LENGTH=481 /DNA_ID=CAMNT_0049346879 /DNA_START=22 /DNA_END=1467 /DNA_ORIENTATION=+